MKGKVSSTAKAVSAAMAFFMTTALASAGDLTLASGSIEVFDVTTEPNVIQNVSGAGTLLVLQTTLDVTGTIDMPEGAMETFGVAQVYVSGKGSIGNVELGDGTMTLTDSSSRRFGALDIEALGLAGGTILLKGFESDDPQETGYGSWLGLGSIQAFEPESLGATPPVGPSGTIHVAGGDALLVLGSKRGSVEATRRMAVDAAAFSARPGMRPTLIVPSSGVDSIGSVAVTVGDAIAKDGIITIGSDARLLVDDTSSVVTAAANATATVETQVQSDIVIWGWRGQDLVLDWLKADDESTVTLLGTNFYGEIERSNGTIHLIRRYFADLVGLNAKTAVSTAESLAQEDLTRRLPGYAFLTDAFGAHDRVGIDVMANTIDAGVFLPMASGIALGVEQNHRMSERSVLDHLRRAMKTETHWWVNAWGGRFDRDRYFDGGSGTWGVSADYSGVALGVDTRLDNGWMLGVSVSGSTVDGETTGRVAATDSEATSAAVSFSAAKATDTGRWLMALTASRAQTESIQLTNAHRLHVEPDMTMVSLSGQWIGQYDAGVRLEPRLGVSVYWGKMQDGIVTDTDLLTANSGAGFDTEASDRLWGVVETGVDLSHRLDVGGLSVVPKFGVDVRYAFGDLAWELTSRLHGTRIGDRTAWDATSNVSGRVSLALDVMHCYDKPKLQGGWFGFGAKPVEGQTETIDWRLSVGASYERGQGGGENAVVGVDYRLNF